MIICNNLCSSLILVIWRKPHFANDHLQRNEEIIVARNDCHEEQLSRGTIVVRDIVARDIVVRDFIARDFVARDIVVRDIVTRELVARDIVARDIEGH